MPPRLDHVVIAVTDYERSNRFYADVLGVEVEEISRGRYAYRLADGQQTQLWMVAVDLTKLGSGTDPSFPAFWLPFQDIAGGNHIAQWSSAVVRARCGGGATCPSRETCRDGTCY